MRLWISWAAGRGKGGRKLGNPTVPRRAGEVGACAALGNHIFTVSSGNKARDGDTLRTTKEAMVTYLGTTLGEETSKEFATGVTTVLTLPPQDPYSPTSCRRGWSMCRVRQSYLHRQLRQQGQRCGHALYYQGSHGDVSRHHPW